MGSRVQDFPEWCRERRCHLSGRPGECGWRWSPNLCLPSLVALALKNIDYETVAVNLIKDGGQQVRRPPPGHDIGGRGLGEGPRRGRSLLPTRDEPCSPAPCSPHGWRRLLALPRGTGRQAVQQLPGPRGGPGSRCHTTARPQEAGCWAGPCPMVNPAMCLGGHIRDAGTSTEPGHQDKACVSAATGLRSSARSPPGVTLGLRARAFPRGGGAGGQ